MKSIKRFILSILRIFEGILITMGVWIAFAVMYELVHRDEEDMVIPFIKDLMGRHVIITTIIVLLAFVYVFVKSRNDKKC
ncbi:MAG TPA: hypothetical protein VK153_00500 [Candidatus Paceibacterota bacterium]|nr:hypothetical protein [Candidatus Paceibacterota bacterium]